MCNLVGIYGRRGSGRRTAAWLIANTIEEIRKGITFEKYKVLYECWAKLVMIDEHEICSTAHVVLDSFGDRILDQVKQMCPALNAYNLHADADLNHYIDPVTFDIQKFDKESEVKRISPTAIIFTAEQYWKAHQFKGVSLDESPGYMKISEFVMYYAHYVMKSAFGENVWTNIASAENAYVASPDTRIYWDCKTDAELRYVYENGGSIINVTNPERESDGGFRDIKIKDPDYVINTKYGLENCAEQFWFTTNKILKRY
jgi:hypothetical protein